MAVILIGGGARSGKSRFALEKARQIAGLRVFVATAEALDEEMGARIERHKEERSAEFKTIEAPLDLPSIVSSTMFDAMVVDCLTLWLSNIMFAHRDCDGEVDALALAARSAPGTVLFVTNEVGCGIVPDNALAREFRDRAGFLNQRIASIADEVYVMAFGQALRVK
ncbi:MAG TPA: bifunctional adenosylcobinamide kinase/adenosylcobinamide-phosphate guanylyltransferase [Bryobacteraceae bacterium]|nr:bifunctional adenosylcobinamide kinase/adenosylcobinamide-phosphate guanylyltransferase [Bryobacteraceae bacterium]